MAKIIFTPISVLTGLVAGLIGTKIFEKVWAVFDEEDPPDPKHRDVSWKKVIAALMIQGAIFRTVRGVVDRGSRKGFEYLTGSWPGKPRPEPES